jgi:hypothetical protein
LLGLLQRTKPAIYSHYHRLTHSVPVVSQRNFVI